MCAACHTVAGMKIRGNAGPVLTHIASRTTIASGIYDNTEENLTSWITDQKNMKLIQQKETLEQEKKNISKKQDKSLFAKSKEISEKIVSINK